MYLYNWSPVVSRCSHHLSGNIRVPGNARTPNSRAGVGHLDDGLVLTEIPHDRTTTRRCGRQDVLDLEKEREMEVYTNMTCNFHILQHMQTYMYVQVYNALFYSPDMFNTHVYKYTYYE